MVGKRTRLGVSGRGEQPSRSKNGPAAKTPSVVGVVARNVASQAQDSPDSKKYSWTLLNCWSQHMFNKFQTHIEKDEYSAYSKRSLGKTFFTTIHGRKRNGISIDDPEFQIFEIQKVGEIEKVKGSSKLQIGASEIRCANNIDTGRPIPTWSLVSHLELAEALHDSLKENDYLAVWGAVYNKKSKSARLNSIGGIKVPETVMAIYRHKSSFSLDDRDVLNLPTQERNVSHHFIQEGDKGIVDLVQEIFPTPTAMNGKGVQGEESGDDDETSDMEKDDSDYPDKDDKASASRSGSPKPSTSAITKKRATPLAAPNPSEKSPAPVRRKERSLSDDAIMKEFDDPEESNRESPDRRSRSGSVEVVAEYEDSDSIIGRPKKRNRSANTASKSKSNSTSTLTSKKKRKPRLFGSDSEKSNDSKDEEDNDSDELFSPKSSATGRKKRVRRKSSSSYASSSTIPTRPNRAAKAKALTIVDETSSDDNDPESPKKRATKSTSPMKIKDKDDDHDEMEVDQVDETISTHSTAHKSKESELTDNSIVLDLETQKFGEQSTSLPPKSVSKEKEIEVIEEFNDDNENDNDSDWNPPEASPTSDSEKEEDKVSDVETKSDDESDDEYLDTKRQKMGKEKDPKVVRKLFQEEIGLNIKPCVIKVNRDDVEKFEQFKKPLPPRVNQIRNRTPTPTKKKKSRK